MCGIAGVSWPGRGNLGEVVEEMSAALIHRGPDSAGTWGTPDGSIFLGHRRLAILDLTAAGHQPMHYPGSEATIVFNGEIYNYEELRLELGGYGYRFGTQCDTEVILAAYLHWGEACVERLNGMFAFAIHDAAKDCVYLARDRAGEKPLYYWHSGNVFAFASELKALLLCPAVSRRLSLQAMNFFLAYGYVPGDMCILDGVRKLQAGRTLVYDRRLGQLRGRVYWSLPEPPSRSAAAPDSRQLVDELETLLADSVRRQMVADVPVGILLSGGVDSSIVTALASRVRTRPVRTFTVSFPNNAAYDEASYAQIVAAHFGTDHTVLSADSASTDLLPELARQFDEPLADSSMIPTYLVSRLIRQHATVAIGGDGGDELFAGYPHYRWLQRQEQLRRWVPGGIRTALAGAVSRLVPIGVRGRSYAIGAQGSIGRSFAFVNQFYDARWRQRIFAPLRAMTPAELEFPERYKEQLSVPGESVVEKATAVDFTTYLADDILVKVDRASMLTSLEVRAPFLDYRVIEFAFGRVPESLKTDGAQRKILPRLLGERLLPRELHLDRKQGFSIPLAGWLRGEWGEFMRSVILGTGSCFAQHEVAALLRNQGRGLNNQHRIFALTMFELWRREYGVTW